MLSFRVCRAVNRMSQISLHNPDIIPTLNLRSLNPKSLNPKPLNPKSRNPQIPKPKSPYFLYHPYPHMSFSESLGPPQATLNPKPSTGYRVGHYTERHDPGKAGKELRRAQLMRLESYWGILGLQGLSWGYIGIMEDKMETTI